VPSPPYSSPPSPSGSKAIPSEDAISPLSGGSAEYLSADLPTRKSYNPHHGARYDAGLVSFGPPDGTVTHTGLGDYTVDFPRLADNRSIIDIRAYASRAICYTIDQRVVGVDEQVRVHCVRLVRAFPTVTTSTDSRYTIAVIQPPRP
jgi:hypothetical protein